MLKKTIAAILSLSLAAGPLLAADRQGSRPESEIDRPAALPVPVENRSVGEIPADFQVELLPDSPFAGEIERNDEGLLGRAQGLVDRVRGAGAGDEGKLR